MATSGRDDNFEVDAQDVNRAKAGLTVGVEPVLQDEYGGDLVNDFFPVAGATADGIEMAVGLGGTQPFIPEVHRQVKFSAKAVGKFLRREGARAAIAGEMDRPSNDNLRAGIATQQATERTQIAPRIGMNKGKQGLGGQAELVGDGDADALRTMVETENPWHGLRDGSRG